MDNGTGHEVRSARHLHPLSLIFEIARMVRGNIIPTIAALISAKNGGWIGFGIGLSIISIGIVIALIRFYTYRYQISDGELVIHEGLFGRLHRTVPVSRIQNIDLLQNVFHRLLGVAVLRLFSGNWYVLRFHGYRLELHDNSLHVQCGLLTKVSATIPRGRVQLVSVQRSWLARRFGLATIRIETAGGSKDKSEDAASSIGRKWFVPIIDYKEVPFVLSAIDERIKFDEPTIEWRPVSRDAAKRMIRPISIVACAVFLLGLYVRPTGGWAIGILVGVVGWLYVAKKSKSRRYARTDWGIIYRSGTLLQKCSMTFFEKMQSASLNQSPFDRRWEMATLTVDTASAGPADHRIQIGYLDAKFASQEFDTIRKKIHFAEN